MKENNFYEMDKWEGMRPENVLLVDDNELLRLVMLRYFSKQFQHVEAVGTGSEAMEYISKKFYHIVILDKNLPDMDGLDILPYIAAKSPRSSVVMITSDADDGVKQEALRRGAFRFFEKPLDFDRLKAALRGRRIFKQVQARINEKHEGMTHDLSHSGMLVNTDAIFQCGATVDILLQTPDNREIHLKGTVVRTADSACNLSQIRSAETAIKYAVGMQLVNPPPEYYSFVQSLIV